MDKKTTLKLASEFGTTPDEKDIAPRLQKLIRFFSDEMRAYDPNDILSFVSLMLYCTYVSRNAESLGLEDFDVDYSIDEAKNKLGNKYVATAFVEYYAGLYTQKPNLPDLRGFEVPAYDLSRAIGNWSSALIASGLSLKENPEDGIASAIQHVLAELFTSDAWGRHAGEFSTPLPIADLVTKLVDVEGKSVIDFVCGNGIVLATALSNGASSATGRDIDAQAIMRARILCFFAGPTNHHNIVVANALTAASATTPAQRVFVAPPLGMRLREFDIREKDYYADVLASIMGKGAMSVPNMEDFCIAKAFSLLADDGVAILHVSASFLFHQQRSRQSLRRAMVEGGYLQAVIELPGGCIPGTGVKSALIVIAKQPTQEGVFIVDFDSKEIADKGYVNKGRGRCDITDKGIGWLVEAVKSRKEIPLVSTVADRERILASGSNLCYSSYGDVFDYGSILAETRPTKKIMGDIQAAQTSIDSLSEQIADILKSIEMKG